MTDVVEAKVQMMAQISELAERASGPVEVVGLSGGYDSTAMALRLEEVEPASAADRWFICTPTGDELPAMMLHWRRLELALGCPIHRLKWATLDAWVEHWNAVPNQRMRWCARKLKLEPWKALFAKLPEGSLSVVGLRADEPERTGIVGDMAVRYPLREWGWRRGDVVDYVRLRGVEPPPRTDCARCPFQRLGEWWSLWSDHPDIFEHAAAQERACGHTFRSAHRDSWPASLDDMGSLFAAGHRPRGAGQMELFRMDAEAESACRVCRL